MTVELQIFFTAMMPLLELRAAIPLAVLVYEMNPYSAYLWAVLGNIFPIFIILAFLEPTSLWLSRNFSFMEKFFNYLFERTRRNYSERVGKYGFFALFLFTAIPLPVSGAWTASLAVFLFGLPYFKSLAAIISGVIVAGGVVLFLTQAGIEIGENYGFQAVGGLILLVLFIYFIYHRKKNNYKKNV